MEVLSGGPTPNSVTPAVPEEAAAAAAGSPPPGKSEPDRPRSRRMAAEDSHPTTLAVSTTVEGGFATGGSAVTLVPPPPPLLSPPQTDSPTSPSPVSPATSLSPTSPPDLPPRSPLRSARRFHSINSITSNTSTSTNTSSTTAGTDTSADTTSTSTATTIPSANTNTNTSKVDPTPHLVIFNKPQATAGRPPPSPSIIDERQLESMTFAYLNQSLPSLSVLLESLDVVHHHEQQVVVPLPLTHSSVGEKNTKELGAARPASPLNLSPMSMEEDVESGDSSASAASSLNLNQTPMSKRNHALHELLSSERNYASDLALIRDVHIPLALGHTLNIPLPPANPPSSSSSSRTLSTASDGSSSSSGSPHGPPMSVEDTQIIFGNVPELALFADVFSEELEDALGCVLEGGTGEDHVGELFLRVIPALEAPYKQYITRHSKALAHLNALPRTPALVAYLTHTQTVAQALSHAWDISSLLIKPVQRFLKYSLLLSAIIEETPAAHGDKENLRKAKERMDEVARSINESRRRWEVVQGVLAASAKPSADGASPNGAGGAAGGGAGGGGGDKPSGVLPGKKKGLNVGTAASVNISKIKSNIRPFVGKGNEEALRVQAMEAEIKAMSTFTQDYAKSIVEWSKTVSGSITALRAWAIGFGQVLGLNQIQNSEAFEAFVGLIESGLMPLSTKLEEDVKETILVQLARLRKTRESPLKLIAAMKDAEPAHYHLLTMTVSAKNRPAPALLESSQTYLALRGQLALELPTYLRALHRGLGVVITEFAAMQARFYGDVRDKWGELWDALRVDGEMNAGGEETVKVWWSRWRDVDEVVAGLGVVRARKMGHEGMQQVRQGSVPMKVRANSGSSAGGNGRRPGVQTGGAVMNMLSSLDPSHAMATSPQSPQSIGTSGTQPSSRTRGRGSSDASTRPRGVGKRVSSEAPHPHPHPHAQPVSIPTASGSSYGPSTSYGYSPSSFPTAGITMANGMHARPDSMGSFVDVGVGPWGSAGNGVADRSSGASAASAAGLPPPPDYETLANGGDPSRMYARHSSSSTGAAARPVAQEGGGRTHRASLPTRTNREKEKARIMEEVAVNGPGPGPGKDGRGRSSKTSSSSLKARLAGSVWGTGSISMSSSSGSGSGSKSGGNERQSMGVTGQGSSSSSSGGGGVQRSNSLKERRTPSVPRPSRDRSNSRHRADRPCTPTYLPPHPHNWPSSHPSFNSTHNPTHRPSASFSSVSTSTTTSSTSSSLPPHHSTSLLSRAALYQTAVVHPCRPPSDVSYEKIPFLVLKVDRVFDVLYEAGHPALHEGLPLHVDDGEDCLLLVREYWGDGLSEGAGRDGRRERERKVGWALASFLVPLGG